MAVLTRRHDRRDAAGRFAPNPHGPAPAVPAPPAPAPFAAVDSAAPSAGDGYSPYAGWTPAHGPAPAGWSPDDDVVDRYTHSNCDLLAAELHASTGWPLVLICDGAWTEDGEETDDPGEATEFGWIHVGVQHPSGAFLDVEGLADIDDAADYYADWADEGASFGGDVEVVVVACPRDLPGGKLLGAPAEGPDGEPAALAAGLLGALREAPSPCPRCA